MISGRLESGVGSHGQGRRFNPTHQTSLVFEKSALHPVCQHPGVTGFEPGAAATSPAARGRSCSGSEQAGILPVISTSNWRFIGSGVCFKRLKTKIFSSLEVAEKRKGLRCFSLLPGRNRENSRDRGARRPIENRASRGGGQGKTRGRFGDGPRFDPIPSRSSALSSARPCRACRKEVCPEAAANSALRRFSQLLRLSGARVEKVAHDARRSRRSRPRAGRRPPVPRTARCPRAAT